MSRAPPGRGDACWPAIDPEPPLYDAESLSAASLSLVSAGASDFTLQTDQPLRARIGGIQMLAGRRPLSPAEMDGLLSACYGSSSAPTLIASRRVLDFSWHVAAGRGRQQRFRVNATGVLARGGRGCEMTFRALPSATPTLSDVGLTEDLWRRLSPSSGLVVVAGATGQGKSTTLAAIMRRHLSGGRIKAVDIQAPIEFTFSDLRGGLAPASSLGQSEVGSHIESFADGVRSALRRAPDIVMIGEVRDADTARAAVDAAMTGHLVYTTLHAGDVPEIFRRLQALLATASGSRAAAVDILQTFRAGLAQRLVPGAADLSRHPVREHAIATPALRRRLRDLPAEDWPAAVSEAIESAGPGDPDARAFAADAAELLRSGAIDPEAAALLEAGR
ncbi:MAG: ATPase, T2SS/T4P/T4SS family [Rhodospirillaceae bacterium]|nr:ATPase, T2SS/T4P/T4SS family [Rhodospirillaceae bacterium]